MDLPPFLRHAYCWVDEGKDPRFLRSEHVRRQERAAQGREKRKAEEDAADAVNDLKRTNKSLQDKLLLADVQGCGYALQAVAAREEAEHEKKQKKAADLKLKRTRSALAQLTSVKGTMSATADPESQRAWSKLFCSPCQPDAGTQEDSAASGALQLDKSLCRGSTCAFGSFLHGHRRVVRHEANSRVRDK